MRDANEVGQNLNYYVPNVNNFFEDNFFLQMNFCGIVVVAV